ncbi:hypothetical protein, partial [Paraburkholderia sediminicola]|uniref:hypothetical protein n=1 Tax=Paraburkholderia sediminicola TaxID=458836 RepID=UPI0038BC71D0
ERNTSSQMKVGACRWSNTPIMLASATGEDNGRRNGIVRALKRIKSRVDEVRHALRNPDAGARMPSASKPTP